MNRRTYTPAEVERACQLYDQLKSVKEVSDRLSIPYMTVYCWIGRKNNCNSDALNADRHLCRTCQFRMNASDRSKLGGNCDYIEIAGNSRGCTAENCNKYIRGRRKSNGNKTRTRIARENENG